jgi:hypothetical protein
LLERAIDASPTSLYSASQNRRPVPVESSAQLGKATAAEFLIRSSGRQDHMIASGRRESNFIFVTAEIGKPD